MKLDELYRQAEEQTSKTLQDLKEQLSNPIPAVRAILESNEMTQYVYFGIINGNSPEQLLSFIHSMNHAMLDDGDYCIKKVLNKTVTDMKAGLAEITGEEPEIVYDYKVVPGDRYGPTLASEEIIALCRYDTEQYDFYALHKKQIDAGKDRAVMREYLRLSKLARDYLKSLYDAWEKRNKEWVEKHPELYSQ